MASKNKTQVLIGGKIYTMSGYESEEYLQRVAAYLNNKITEIKTAEGYTRMSQEMRGLLLNLNTADDYFKLKEKSDQLSESLSAKDKELYEIKHELISTQMKLDSLTRDLEIEKEDHQEALREMTQLRTRLQDAQDAMKTAERQAPGPAQIEAPQKETPQKEAPQKEAPQEETPQEETPQEETPQEETPQEEAVQAETLQKELPQEEVPQETALQENAAEQSDIQEPPQATRDETPAPEGNTQKSGSGNKKQKYNRYYRK